MSRSIVDGLVMLLLAHGGVGVATGVQLLEIVGGPEPGLVDGDATTARFDKPIRLSPFADDGILVADISNDAVRFVSIHGEVSTVVPRPEGAEPCGDVLTRPEGPHGVAWSSWSGSVAIAEASGQVVRVLERVECGERSGWLEALVIGSPGEAGYADGTAEEARFRSPHAVAWDSEGGLWIADIGNRRIRRWQDGRLSTVAGDDDGPFVYPMDLVVHPEGGVVVIDAATGLIYRVWASGEVTELPLAAPLATPHGVAVSETGRVFVAEMDGHRVVEVERDGAVKPVWGTGATGAGERELARPAALLVHRGRLWIADLDNHRIVILASPDPVEP
jgi:DNA-binding beta-propeller fold protein YncE